MIDMHLSFNLPTPWKNQVFETEQVGKLNFMVGPNGSGKSQFAKILNDQLKSHGTSRLLGTDRLMGMGQSRAFDQIIGDSFGRGFNREDFPHLKEAGQQGSGIDALVFLEERMDLRVQVEATLSHLFGRELSLEWDSGRLMAKMRRLDDNALYRIDREECHGIKELLVLLTHLYDDEHEFLIIDEPELNLHPQYQAFFIQEVRRVTGQDAPNPTKTAVFLVTHSPFVLDLRQQDDLASMICFDLEYSIPKQVANLNVDLSGSTAFTRRLNAHHKQMFFSDNPIFVEGIHDAWLIEALMEARGESVPGSGSSIIDAGGAEVVNDYLKLCLGLGKQAHFLYDLDSLFSGNLRQCINEDESVRSFLATSGIGNDFVKYCGELQQHLTDVIDQLLGTSLPPSLHKLGDFLTKLGPKADWTDKRRWPSARTAVMTAISRYKTEVSSVISPQSIKIIEGRLNRILEALEMKNIHVLPGGTIERYMPLYQGDEFQLSLDAKRNAVLAELDYLTSPRSETDLISRYGELYDAIKKLPSKPVVSIDPVLCKHLSRFIYELQVIALSNPSWNLHQMKERLNSVLPGLETIFSILEFNPIQEKQFEATIRIVQMHNQPSRTVKINHLTNSAMDEFDIISPTNHD